jgi:putative adhesin
MIGSIPLLSALLLAAPTADRHVRVHIPGVGAPDLHLPEVDIDLRGLDLLALAEHDEEDHDEADPDDDSHRRPFRFRVHEQDEEREPSARAAGKDGTATLAVKGPITFRVRVQSGEVEVVPSEKAQITVVARGGRREGEVQLLQYGDRVEARIGNHRELRRGRLRVELPKGSSVEFASTSGDLSVENVGGDVRARTMSGDMKVSGARKADLQSVSGDVLMSASGPQVRLYTVSGNAMATTTDPAVQLDFRSASGNLEWSGVCAKGCRLSAETVSGQIELQPDPAKSSFELSFASHSGDFRDELKLDVKRAPKRKHGGMSGWLEAVYGKGEGVIECDAFSGDVVVRKK